MATMFRGARLASVLLASVALGAVSSVANAQAPGPLLIDAPQDVPSGQAMPIGSLQPIPERVSVNPATAAPMPAQPDGGFQVSPPTVDAQDPANRMNLGKSEEYLGKLDSDTDKRLDEMVSGQQANGAGLPVAGVTKATASDIDTLAALKRRTLILEEKKKQAELSVTVWGTLFNNPNAKEWREREDKEKEAKREADERAASERALQSAQSALSSGGPGRQIAMPASMSAEPVVSEVNGGTAYLLVPGSGEVPVKVGTRLSTGHKVARISASGVEVTKDGERTTLGFGNSANTPSMASAGPSRR